MKSNLFGKDDTPPLATCEMCGVEFELSWFYPNDVLCPRCKNDQIDLENRQYAIEEFNAAINKAMTHPQKEKLAYHIVSKMQTVMLKSCNEDALWFVTDAINLKLCSIKEEKCD